MTESTYRLNIYRRRLLTIGSKLYNYGFGIIAVAIGVFGQTKQIDGLNSLYILFLLAGILNILVAIIGKSVIKEKNFVSIGTDVIEFKNSFQKSQKIQLANIYDIIISSNNIEFVLNDQQVRNYDISILLESEKNSLFAELAKIKNIE